MIGYKKLTFLPYVNLIVLKKKYTPVLTGRKIPFSFKTVCDPDLLSPLSAFGLLANVGMCFDRLTLMEHLAELCFQLTPRDA